jgi:hypothetical protein
LGKNGGKSENSRKNLNNKKIAKKLKEKKVIPTLNI